MAGTARYMKVKKDLRRLIIDGYYEVGDLLPSENELCKQYSMTRMTVRNALNNMETEGLIYRKKGKGSIVKLKGKSIELLSIKGFTEVLKGQEDKIDTLFVQNPTIGTWDQDFFWNLNQEELSAGCIYMSRVRTLHDRPIMLEKTFLSNNDLPNFISKVFINKSLFDTLIVNYDIEMIDVIQKFRAISASQELAEALNLEIAAPVLEIIRKLSTSRPGFYVYSFSYCNTKEFTIEA
jgi:DNA-binding GntR family transcriptional regulator